MTLLLVLVASVFPGGKALAAGDGSWMQPSLDQLVKWGVMTGYGDGNLFPNNAITRAEFVAMVNRAYGHATKGTSPFQDVAQTAWYADDIAIAYRAGYFSGTSANEASPNARLTREQAMVLLAQNMRLNGVAGQVTEFSDGNQFSYWSKEYVKAAVQQGLISGYTDGTFRPKNYISRGEMAVILTKAVGTLIGDSGEHTLTGVFGNVTITAPNVTLRNTTIAGDLYLSGGIDLSSVTLENVNVLGRIIVAGGGESENSSASIALRNVDAKELVVDAENGQYVSLSVEGDSQIKDTTVRSPAYIQDRTSADKGLLSIVLDGESGTAFNLAGNLKTVVNQTPKSTLTIAQGTAQTLTIDEAATNSRLVIGTNAAVKTLNLDVGTAVTGKGDVQTLNVAAAGTSTAMLPDQISIRPGITASIAGQTMDTAAGKESSVDPRLLAGYPKARDVAPTAFSAVFSGNKSGTVYWAVSSIADGSVGEDNLISPPSYGSLVAKSGTVRLSASSTEVTAKVTGLTTGGSYYLSAILVDVRGNRSPVKVISFSTPDNTVPAFAPGYPYMSKITSDSGQVTVMATKSCRLYYALLPKGSTAPTAAEFRTAAITGNLGYGVADLTKNVTDTFTANSQALKELATYDLYLCLSDADGTKSSAVKKITFTTIDGTPPVFQTLMTVNSVKITSLGLSCNLNEQGTVYWVAVKSGTEYPKTAAGSTPYTDKAEFLKTDYAKLQVMSGMNGLKSGKVAVKANTDAAFTISGLTAETAYDIYYVAVDKAGNYSDSVYMLTANTLDDAAPTVAQKFTHYAGTNTTAPYADTDVYLVFSEGVQQYSTRRSLLSLYQTVQSSTGDARVQAKEELAAALRGTILLRNATGSGQAKLVEERTATNENSPTWVIDYRNAKVTMDVDGKLTVTFPGSGSNRALNLSSGSTYYFQITDIADTSLSVNQMGDTDLDRFTTISAQAYLGKLNVTSATVDGLDQDIHMAFSLTPMSTSTVDDSTDWDLLLWSDTPVVFTLYARERTSTSAGDWVKLGDKEIATTSGTFQGISLGRDFLNLTRYPMLNQLDESKVYEYGIQCTQVGTSSDPTTWSQTVTFRASVVSGSSVDLANLATSVTEENFSSAISNGEVSNIGSPSKFTVYKRFSDSRPPEFTGGYPTFHPMDTYVDMTVRLDRSGTVYYAVAPVGIIGTQKDGQELTYEDLGTGGIVLDAPSYLNIINPTFSNSAIKTGTISAGTGAIPIQIDGLKAETKYFVYFVLKGSGQTYSSTLLYGFETSEVTRPIITLEVSNPSVVIKSDQTATVDYQLLTYNLNNMSSVLTQNFCSKCVSASQQAEVTEYLEGIGESASSFNCLRAMATDYNGQGSLFDQYASQAAKEAMAEYIRTRTPDAGMIVKRGSVPVLGGSSTTVNCSAEMSKDVWYCFLAVGKSAQGSNDSFRAIYPVQQLDTQAPKVVLTSLDGSISPSGNFVGTLFIQFDEPLYFKEQDQGSVEQSIRPVAAVGIGSTQGEAISVLNVISAISSTITPVYDTTSGSAYTACQALTFDLSGVSSGATITFNTQLCDSGGNVRKPSLYIQIKIVDGVASVVIPSSWDAREN
ncbi:MAG: S-layer homology domain-containing protein [Lawsonibacter sp.]|nr:S-layer homology domain-containing protein [Lawsonibacter sp.]